MPSVTVKDVNQQDFVRALSAFLKKRKRGEVTAQPRRTPLMFISCCHEHEPLIHEKMHGSFCVVIQSENEMALNSSNFPSVTKRSGKLKVPEWVDTVKLARHKELAPCDDNWFYTRAASTARHLYLRGGVGVGSMIKVYGGRQRNGVCPAHFSVGSRNVARKVLQALEGLKMVEKDPNGGRRLTPQGQRDLDRIAGQVASANKKQRSLQSAI